MIDITSRPEKMEYWVQNVLPQVHDDSLSYQELLYKVINLVNEVVDLSNLTKSEVDELYNFIYNSGLSEIVNGILEEWYSSGRLGEIINEMLFTDLNNRIIDDEVYARETSGYGVLVGLDVVAQENPDMSVVVKSGIGHTYNGKRYIQGSDQRVSISPANATYGRWDIVYITPNGLLTYLAGEPNAVPVKPEVEEGSIVLAYVYVNNLVVYVLQANVETVENKKVTLPELVELVNGVFSEVNLLGEEVDINTEQIGVNTQDIVEMKQDEVTLREDVDSNTTQISTNSQDIGEMKLFETELREDVDNNILSINSLTQDVSTLNVGVLNLSGVVNGFGSYNNEATGNGVIVGLMIEPQDTPNMSVKVSNGIAHTYGGVRYNQQVYENVNIEPTSGVYPRIDVIYISAEGVLLYGKGDESALPIAPMPVKSLILAEIYVSETTNVITENEITDKRKFKTTIPEIVESFNNINEDIVELSVKVGDIVTPEEFGAIGNANYFNPTDYKTYEDASFTIEAHDDTLSIQNAIDYCIANKKALKLSKKYKITKLVINNSIGFTLISDGAQLVGNEAGNYSSMIEISDGHKLTFLGTLELRGSYNQGYECGIWCRINEVGHACAFLNFYEVNFTGLKLAWKFGDVSTPDATISEITVFGGDYWGCPCCVEVIGVQTIIDFISPVFLSDEGVGDETWKQIPKVVIKSVGGGIRINGGEVLNVLYSDGTTFLMQPIFSIAQNKNSYGNIYCENSTIESVCQLALLNNPEELTNVTGGGLYLYLCSGYHFPNSFDFIFADSGYRGKIIVDKCNFFGGTPRTFANVKAIEDECNIWVDSMSFGNNFIKGLGGIVGGTVHFSHRVVLDVTNTNAQQITDAIQNTVVFKSVNQNGDLLRFKDSYNTTTGEFTVPVGGLENVEIFVNLYVGSAITSADLMIMVDGTAITFNRIGVGGSSYLIQQKLNGGQKVKVVVVPNGDSGSLSTNFNSLRILASNH